MESPQLLAGREVPLGGVRGMSVTRWLPHRSLPTVGAWCFVDRIGPQRVDMRVQPHPHTALQTVTWPLVGQIRHRDSLGSDVVVRPGELNLMTAGRGVSHSEHSLGELPLQHGLQLWVVLPREQDDAPARFEQQRELPVLEVPGARATVLVGSLGEGAAAAVSPARVAPGLVGADVVLDPGARVELPLEAAHEHAVLLLEGDAAADGAALGATAGGSAPPLVAWRPGRASLPLRSEAGARLLLLGGTPHTDDLVMWWNFIGRTHEDVLEARRAWEDPDQTRYGSVPGHTRAERIPAPPLPPVRLAPRRPRPPLPGAEAPAFS